MLYFDHAASTPPYPEVIASVAQAMERYYANP
jgi:cysteine desulfurase